MCIVSYDSADIQKQAKKQQLEIK